MNAMQHMRDPAAGVNPSLLPHMHLVCKNRYPINNNPSLETIVGYLLEAGKIVRDLQPMQWQFLESPPDGSLMLTWQPLEHTGTLFASDGYIYGEPEQSFKSEVRGYTLEMFHQRTGYRQGEAVASHSRRRFRLLPGNPTMPTPDPALFIVSYSKAHGRDTIPSASIPILPQIAQQLNQRRAIQAQGQLARKDFMLHDRSNWPQINAPQGMSRGGQGHRRGTSLGNETTVEEEEDVSRGDILDFMTPREISRMRYEQHHEWMEEVLESPYNIYQIVPGDLGLGRKGELEELTKDFFDAPTAVLSNTSASSEIGQIRKLDSDKAEDFKRRANQKIAEMQAEIDAMKAKHAKRVAKLQRTTVLNSAERRLRSAPTAASGRSMSSGSLAEQPDIEAIDEIASEVEHSISKKIERVANVTTVSKGGLQEHHTERTFSTSSASRPVMSPMKTTSSPAISQSAFSQQPQHGIHHQQQAQAQLQPLNTTATSASSSGSEAGPHREPGQDVQPSSEEKTPADNEGIEDTELPPMDDMGMDLDTDASANNPDVEYQSPSGAEWVMVDDQAEQGTGDNADMDIDGVPRPESKPEETKVPTTEQQGPPALPATAEQDAEELTLDDNAFGDEFDNVDVDTAGDALASYGDDNDEDLNLDAMDDSAFGDAFHQEDDADIS